MVKRYNPHSEIDISARLVEDEYGVAVHFTDYEAAIDALRLLFEEMKLSGNLGSKDYGWPKAIAASLAILESQSQNTSKDDHD